MKNLVQTLLSVSILLSGLSCGMAQDFILVSAPDVGSSPISIATADVNGDGKPDLIDANFSDNTVTVLTNNGNGGFVVSTVLPVGSGPSFVVAADLNGDGKPDLACANFYDNTVTIYTNGGNGIFVSNTTIAAGIRPQCIITADLRGSGNQDLIVADFGVNGSGDTLMILTNNGSGAFNFSTNLTVGAGSTFVIACDVNGDGWPDLISANANDDSLTVLTNNGAGVFAQSAVLAVGAYPESVVAADVDGDGALDLIAANYADDSLTVWTNSGNGLFGFNGTINIDPGSGPAFVAACDVNSDGKPDLITANANVSSLTVLTNDGSGGFVQMSSPTVGVNPNAVVAADFNGDGRPDLASANFSDVTVSVLINAPTPVIHVGLSDSIAVSWSLPATNWTLQTNPDLTATNWANFGGTVNDDGTSRSVTVSSPAGNLFFRLTHP